MRLLVDMNLSPQWAAVLVAAGHEARHWSEVGDVRASDAKIMDWARANGAVVLTHDLDFTTLLALTRADGPSVVQLRAQNILPESLAESVLQALEHHAAALAAGAIVSIDHMQARVRILPLT
jgi:predicted nuclease of predicted toxin-antitoxin system